MAATGGRETVEKRRRWRGGRGRGGREGEGEREREGERVREEMREGNTRNERRKGGGGKTPERFRRGHVAEDWRGSR